MLLLFGSVPLPASRNVSMDGGRRVDGGCNRVKFDGRKNKPKFESLRERERIGRGEGEYSRHGEVKRSLKRTTMRDEVAEEGKEKEREGEEGVKLVFFSESR